MVEAVVEDEALKMDVFATLDRVVADPDAILASNTSSIPIMKLAMATKRPEQVIGIHFFNPVPVLRLVELVTSLLTSPATDARADAFATEQLGKQVIRVPGPGRLHRQRPADPLPAVGHPHAGVGLRHRRATSTRAWSRAAPTRWARWPWPT